MKFGPVPVAQAVGAILAHSLRHAGGVIRKGTVLDRGHVEQLERSGVTTVTVARLEPRRCARGRSGFSPGAGDGRG